jgi:hypothetical protein
MTTRPKQKFSKLESAILDPRCPPASQLSSGPNLPTRGTGAHVQAQPHANSWWKRFTFLGLPSVGMAERKTATLTMPTCRAENMTKARFAV